MEPRFLEVADVAEMLSISARQAYKLVRSGELPAIQVGGRGQWRIEATKLEDYIQGKYAQTRAMIDARPDGSDDDGDDETTDTPTGQRTSGRA